MNTEHIRQLAQMYDAIGDNCGIASVLREAASAIDTARAERDDARKWARRMYGLSIYWQKELFDERREHADTLGRTREARAVELYDNLVLATADAHKFEDMTNADLADAVLNVLWADTPIFTEKETLLDVVIDRLRKTP